MLRNQIKQVLFSCGGCDQKGIPVDSLYMYYPEKDFWFPLASMSVLRAQPICSILSYKDKDYLVALGGVGNDPPQEPVNAIELYDIANNVWSRLTDMTKPLMGMAGLTKNNNLLIFGGMQVDTNPTDDVRILTLVDGSSSSKKDWKGNILPELSWKRLPPMKHARYTAQALDFNDLVFLIGGRVGKTPQGHMEVYDKNAATWTTLPECPLKTAFCSIRKVNNFIFIFGGIHDPATRGFSNDVYYYDTNKYKDPKNEWKQGPKMQMKRGDFAAAVKKISDNKHELIVAGGMGVAASQDFKQGRPLDSAEVLVINENGPKKWTSIKGLENGRGSFACCQVDNQLYISGGIQHTEGSDLKDTTKNGPCDKFTVLNF